MQHESTVNISTSLEDRIQEVIERDIKPFVLRDGGFVRFCGIDKGIVFIELSGACKTCSALDMTLKVGIERVLRKSFPDVRAVQLWKPT
jgi:Fe-S cluster biogenesis protein NfuA